MLTINRFLSSCFLLNWILTDVRYFNVRFSCAKYVYMCKICHKYTYVNEVYAPYSVIIRRDTKFVLIKALSVFRRKRHRAF